MVIGLNASGQINPESEARVPHPDASDVVFQSSASPLC